MWKPNSTKSLRKVENLTRRCRVFLMPKFQARLITRPGGDYDTDFDAQSDSRLVD